MAQVIKFASDIDGTQFDTLAEQLTYDAAKQNEVAINAFLDKHYPKAVEGQGKTGPSRKIVAKGLALWLAEQAQPQPEVEAAE